MHISYMYSSSMLVFVFCHFKWSCYLWWTNITAAMDAWFQGHAYICSKDGTTHKLCGIRTKHATLNITKVYDVGFSHPGYLLPSHQNMLQLRIFKACKHFSHANCMYFQFFFIVSRGNQYWSCWIITENVVFASISSNSCLLWCCTR